MAKKIVFILFCLFWNLSSFSQNFSIEGTISDPDGRPLPGISIYFKDARIGTYSNGSGFFKLEVKSSGNYKVIFSGLGFISQEKSIEIKKNSVEISIFLEESVSELEEIVISGGKKGIKDIPGSVQYLSAKDLDRFSYTDINRALKTVPGVNIQEEEGFGLRPNIGLRASGSERSSKITLMEDGILIAPAPYVAPAAYYFPTIGRMQGIEVMKGNAQIKYGPYTTGGALNLISSGIPNKLSGKINLLYGSFGSYNLNANIGNSHKNVSYMVETYQYGSNGFKQLDGGGNTGFSKSDYLGKIRFNTNEKAKVYQSVMLKIGLTNESGQETYLGLTDDDFNENPYRRYFGSQKDVINTEHRQISITHIAKFSKSLSLTTSIYRNDFKRNWYKIDKLTDSLGNSVKIADVLEQPEEYNRAYNIIKGSNTSEDERLLVKANNRSYYAQGVQSALKYKLVTEKVSHKFEVGLRLHKDQIDRFQWIDEYIIEDGSMLVENAGIPGTESNRVEWANALATYGQYQFKYGKLTVTPGLRYEHIELTRFDYGKNDVDRTSVNLKENTNVVNVLLPGFGVDYKLNQYNSVFVGYHKGFAPPGTKEGTLPEKSDNYELGHRIGKKSLSVQTVVFYNDYQNLLGADLNANGGSGSNDLFNGGTAESKGLEIQLNYDILGQNKTSKLSLPVQVAYTYTDAKFLSSFDSNFEGWGVVSKGDQLPYVANNQFSLLFGIEYKRFDLSLNGRYMDAMRTEPGQGEIPLNQKTDAYFVTDISLKIDIRKDIAFFANVINLTDEIYIVARRPSGVRPGMPRAINAGMKAHF